MKIEHLLSNIDIMLSNQEKKFIDNHSSLNVNNLKENELWLVQNLIRKGVYEISTQDNNILIKNVK